jgi:hypothetical protein
MLRPRRVALSLVLVALVGFASSGTAVAGSSGKKSASKCEKAAAKVAKAHQKRDRFADLNLDEADAQAVDQRHKKIAKFDTKIATPSKNCV